MFRYRIKTKIGLERVRVNIIRVRISISRIGVKFRFSLGLA